MKILNEKKNLQNTEEDTSCDFSSFHYFQFLFLLIATDKRRINLFIFIVSISARKLHLHNNTIK